MRAQPATTINFDQSSYNTRTETPFVHSSGQHHRPTPVDIGNDNGGELINLSALVHENNNQQAHHPGDLLATQQTNQNSQSNVEQPMMTTGGVGGGDDTIDYTDVYTNSGGGMTAISPDRTTSFDKTVIDIVSNKDFSNSYPPVPDLNGLADKQTEPNLPMDEFNTANKLSPPQPPPPQPTTTKLTSGNSNSKGKPVASETPPRTSTTANNKNGQPVVQAPSVVQITPTNVATSPVNTKSTVGQQTQYQHQSTTKASSGQEVSIQNDNLSPSNIFGNTNDAPMNLTSLFDKALNESSRIASECLECICDASSNCDTSVQCISKQREKNRCGLYMISWNQFQESDISLTALVLGPNGSPAGEEASDEKMYYECTTDRICAEKLIHLYIEKHQRDCNNDGKIDCYDIAAIHRVGPENCNSGKFLGSQYWKDFNICYTTDRLTTTVQPQVSSQLLYS